MLPAIPQELSDMILDFLHDDVAALCSAGLVCKSWIPASRFHLFSSVLLFDMANRLINHGLEVLCAECSTIPPYILYLRIVGDFTGKGRFEDDIFEPFVEETLRRLPLLSNLKGLSLMHINMANLTPDAKKRLTTLLQNLINLSLCTLNFETVDQVIDFIASAPFLEEIILQRIRCIESCNYSSQAIAPPLRWISCMLDPCVDNIMRWFCRCHPQATSNVNTLEITVTTGDNIPTVCKFIRQLGSALESLSISCSYSDEIGLVLIALSEQIDLSQNTSLRDISFHNLFLCADSPMPRPCGWITSIISKIAHPSLETVDIYIDFNQVEDFHGLELSALDTLFFNQPLSDNSTKLRFYIWSVLVEREVAQAALKDGLPNLDGKKRLEIIMKICHHSLF